MMTLRIAAVMSAALLMPFAVSGLGGEALAGSHVQMVQPKVKLKIPRDRFREELLRKDNPRLQHLTPGPRCSRGGRFVRNADTARLRPGLTPTQARARLPLVRERGVRTRTTRCVDRRGLVMRVTQTGYRDDSVAGQQWQLEFVRRGGQWRLHRYGVRWRCYRGPGRDWTTRRCL